MRTSTRKAIHCTTLRLTSLAGLASVLLSAAPASAKVTKIADCSYTLDSPGTYLITDDLSCEEDEDGIIITVGNVQLNGAHHRITGTTSTGTGTTGTGTGIVVQGTQTDVVIHNLLVERFDTGIRVENASNVTVLGVAATENVNGLTLVASSDVLVRTGVYDHNVADGIHVDEDSDDNVIHAVFARNNGDDGIEVEGDDNVLQANAAEENVDIGIHLTSDATGNDLLANFALGNEIDMADVSPSPPCLNTWKSARFDTDSEGDGRKSGCIQ